VLESGGLARFLTVDAWVVLAYQYGPRLLLALLLAIGTWIGARLARSSFDYASRGIERHARLLIGRVITISIIGIGAATILDTLGVPLTTFVTVLGVAGLGISLAMQDVLKSFVAGTFLLFERPFRIGDEISIKDQRGIVEHIGIRTTRMRNANNVQYIIPNAVVFAEVVANRTNEVTPQPAEPLTDADANAVDHQAPPGASPPARAPSAATSAGPSSSAPPAAPAPTPASPPSR
jgi:small conductance mechanosensitive channel